MELAIRQNACDFLRTQGMSAESFDMAAGVRAFVAEMETGLEGCSGSLEMIPTYVGVGKEIPVGEPVIAIDAGGTNLRVAVIHFDEQKRPVVEGFRRFPMPGTNGRIKRNEFFDTIAGYLAPLLPMAQKIGFCFSYPTEILPNGDGKLIRFVKEVQVDGVEGGLIGKGLLEAVAAAGYEAGKSIILLNDTVATLLAGKAARANHPYGSYIGFILGTGTNTCYIERNANIKKTVGIAPEGAMIINIESGAYDKAPQGVVDRAFDAQTANPGVHPFEKMISGGYFGELALEVLKAAAKAQLLSGQAYEKLIGLKGFATKDVNEFLDEPYGVGMLARCLESAEDRVAAYYLIDGLYERAARFVAVNLAAVIQKSGAGQDPCRPVCITADGTMFHKTKLFRSKLEHYVKVFLNDELGLYADFIEVENASLLGTAIAGLTGV